MRTNSAIKEYGGGGQITKTFIRSYDDIKFVWGLLKGTSKSLDSRG